MTGERSVRCLVADDHPALVFAIQDYLSGQGLEIVGPATDGAQALVAAARERPELALLDFHMPRGGGSELVAAMKRISPETRVLVYTADADERVVAGALAAGADGLVLKEASLVDVFRALTSILAGRPYVDPALAGAALGTRRGAAKAQSEKLTERERQVLQLLAEGLSHEAIGERLGIAPETVRTHARKAAGRLGARTRTQAVATAIRRNLI